MLNKYLHIEYTNDIDEVVFNYSHYGKAVFKPILQWTDESRFYLNNFNTTNDVAELNKGMKILKLVSLTTTRAVRGLVIK